MEEISDTQLLQLYVQKGSQAAFRSLEARYSGMVYGVAMRRLGRHDLAAEVAQEVFLLLSQRAASLHGKALGAWLHQVCIRKAGDLAKLERRHRERASAYAQLHQSEATDSGLAMETESLLRRLDEAIDALPDTDREIILLRYMERLDASDIGKRLGLEATVCQKRLERARAKLAKLLAIPLTSFALNTALERVGADVMEFSNWQSKTTLAPHGNKTPSRQGRLMAGAAGVVAVAVLWRYAQTAQIPDVSTSSQNSKARVVSAYQTKLTPVAQASEAARLPSAKGAAFSLTELAGLLEAADEGDATAAAEAAEMLAPLSGADLETAMGTIPSLTLTLNQLRLVALGTLARLVELDGERAVRVGTLFWREFAGASAPRLCGLIAMGWQCWSAQSPAAAMAWWKQAEAEQTFAPKGQEDSPLVDDDSLARAMEAIGTTRTQAGNVLLAKDVLQAEAADTTRPTWEALSEIWVQKLTESEARSLADELRQSLPAAYQPQLAAFRLRVITAPGRLPSMEALDWAAATLEISQTAVLTAWLQRDMPGTLQWLESLTEADHSHISELLDELLHPSLPAQY